MLAIQSDIPNKILALVFKSLVIIEQWSNKGLVFLRLLDEGNTL